MEKQMVSHPKNLKKIYLLIQDTHYVYQPWNNAVFVYKRITASIDICSIVQLEYN